MLLKLSRLFASVFGVGYLPKAPGTWGSVAGLLIWFFYPAFAMIPILFFLGYAATWCILPYNASKDPSFIVIDEVVGVMITLAIMGSVSLPSILIGFVLFRFFDILKPFPINWLDHYFETKGDALAAFGVMIDDVLAGVFAGILGYIALMIIKL